MECEEDRAGAGALQSLGPFVQTRPSSVIDRNLLANELTAGCENLALGQR